jgi:hypothetical protein
MKAVFRAFLLLVGVAIVGVGATGATAERTSTSDVPVQFRRSNDVRA